MLPGLLLKRYVYRFCGSSTVLMFFLYNLSFLIALLPFVSWETFYLLLRFIEWKI